MVKTRLYIPLLVLLMPVFAFGQKPIKPPFKGAEKKQYELASALVQFGVYEEDFQEALELFSGLHAIDSSFAPLYYQIGLCHYKLRGHEAQAEDWLTEGKKREQTECYYYLAHLKHQAHDFDGSIKLLRYYKLRADHLVENDEIDRRIETVQRAKEAFESPLEVNIMNLGAEVNSEYQDYVPLVTADGLHLYFTSRRPETTGGEKDPNGEYYEDIYYSNRTTGKWTKASNVGSPLNTPLHDATVGLSSNGNALLIFRTNANLTGGDLYLAELGEIDNWKSPKKLGPTVNSIYQEPSACMSPDENLLIFSSNRPEGYGGKDLYYVKKLPNGQWGLPRNLGPNINTEQDEDSPFLSADGKVMHFASNGHTTIGGYDIFRTEQDENGVWSFAENIGYPINTVANDMFFSLSADGKKGYYSSEKSGGYGRQDIYEVDMSFEEAQPAVVKGFVKDADGRPVKAKITLVNEDSKELHGIYNSNASNGKYLLIISPDTRYQMVVEADGFHSHVGYLEFAIDEPLEEIAQEIQLHKDEDE